MATVLTAPTLGNEVTTWEALSALCKRKYPRFKMSVLKFVGYNYQPQEVPTPEVPVTTPDRPQFTPARRLN